MIDESFVTMSETMPQFQSNLINGNLKNVQQRRLSKQNNVNGDASPTHLNKLENGTANGVNNISENGDYKFSTAVVAVDVLEQNQARQSEVVKQAPNAKTVSKAENGTLADRRKSLQKMSTMEQESLLEKEHLSQIRLCSSIIYNDVKYTKESFRRLFLSKVSASNYLLDLILAYKRR